jgi:meso-butanediol dehydrogenase / (S,S)-butanediol dehydrogenase / diacetyl reductase
MANETRSVVITGAASGMGRAAAERLAKAGWQVLATDYNADNLGWTQGVANLSSLVADVSSEADNARIAAEADRLFGGLNAAIFNAGIVGGGAIDEMPVESFRRVFDVNLIGPILGIRACLPLLRRRENAAIVVTASTMGLGGDSENWAYGAAKHGLIGLVKSLSRELGWEGIRINALCPGLTMTGMTGGMEDAAPEMYQRLAAQVPLQRWAAPDEQAAVMEFLISPAASYVSGHALAADGGAIAGTGLLLPASGKQRMAFHGTSTGEPE